MEPDRLPPPPPPWAPGGPSDDKAFSWPLLVGWSVAMALILVLPPWALAQLPE